LEYLLKKVTSVGYVDHANTYRTHLQNPSHVYRYVWPKQILHRSFYAYQFAVRAI